MKPANKTSESIIEPESTPPKIPRRTLALSLILVILTITTLYLYSTQSSGNKLTTFELSSGQSSLIARLSSLFNPESATTDAEQTPAPTPIGSPTVLPTGPQTYKFSHGKEVTGPKPQSLTLEPIDPTPGDTQTITLEINSDSPVKSAEIIFTSDTKEQTLDLKLISGDSQNGTYQISWEPNDTLATKYFLHYILINQTATYDNTMYIR